MTDSDEKAIVPHSSALEIEVPAPGAMFKNRIISERNLALEQMQDTARKLTKQQVKQLKRQIVKAEKQLASVGYQAIVEQRESLNNEFLSLVRQREETADSSLDRRINLLRLSLEIYDRRLERLNSTLVQSITDANDKLAAHVIAVKREKAHNEARKLLAAEAYNFQDIIRATWSRLNFKDEMMIKNRTIIKLPKFSEIHVTPDRLWFKIYTTTKTLAGYDSALPQNVRVADLISDETVFELSIACQRQVESKYSYKSGAWIIVNRLGTTDGLLEHVSYTQVMARYDRYNHHKIPLPVGVQSGRVICWIPSSEYPHYLIAGVTGSGKSNLTKVIISTIITQHAPEDVQLILVDMKEGAEFSVFSESGVPHLALPVVRTPPELAEVLARLEAMRRDRNQQFTRLYAVNIDQYNERVPAEMKMPRVFVIIDEFAAINLTDAYQSDKDNKMVAQRIRALTRQLLAMARSAGIHLILCTQSPYVEILPGPDKANIPVKISGAMPTMSASKTVFDVGDAAKLPNIPGRMLISIGAQMWQIQTPEITYSDVMDAIAKAHEWHNALEFELPEPTSEKWGFDESNVLEIAIREYGGRLSVRSLWDGTIRHLNKITFRDLDSLVKQIVDRESVEFEGQIFTFKKITKGGYQMIAQDETEELHNNTITQVDI